MKKLTKEEMDNLLTTVGDGVLAVADNDIPYCIPFGFVYIKEKVYLSLFPMGRKWDILKRNNKVCFNVFRWNKDHSEWASVIVEGVLEQVKEIKEIEMVVKANMEKVGLDPANYLEKRMAYYQKSMNNPNAVKIFRIEAANVDGRKMPTVIGQ